jgi:hypothetical protein
MQDGTRQAPQDCPHDKREEPEKEAACEDDRGGPLDGFHDYAAAAEEATRYRDRCVAAPFSPP